MDALTACPGTDRGGESVRLLTDAAKSIIRQAIEAGCYSDRAGALEPPFMAPSEDPDDYPMVSPGRCFICRAIRSKLQSGVHIATNSERMWSSALDVGMWSAYNPLITQPVASNGVHSSKMIRTLSSAVALAQTKRNRWQ